VIYTRCHIDTINSPDDGHMAARNMKRIEINIHENNCAASSLFAKNVPSCTVNRTQNIFLEPNSSSESKGIPLSGLRPSGFPPILWKHLFSPIPA
jgi:hypothetical protein